MTDDDAYLLSPSHWVPTVLDHGSILRVGSIQRALDLVGIVAALDAIGDDSHLGRVLADRLRLTAAQPLTPIAAADRMRAKTEVMQVIVGPRIACSKKPSRHNPGTLRYSGRTRTYSDQGAGDGDRTRIASLEGWSSAIELRPRVAFTLAEVADPE